LAALLGTEEWVLRKGGRRKCCDNAVAESFFSSPKNEHVKKKIYKARSIACAAIAEDIDVFYNPIRRPIHLGDALELRLALSTFESGCYAYASSTFDLGNPSMRCARVSRFCSSF
jgi:hypothetical protein